MGVAGQTGFASIVKLVELSSSSDDGGRVMAREDFASATPSIIQ